MKRYTILILDDEPAHLNRIMEVLARSGQPYDVLRAVSASKAEIITRAELPDLIITDWEMPEMNGLDFIRAIRSWPATGHIPIIMCTGVMLTSVDLATALQAGADDFIRKPIDEVELIARTRTMLRIADYLNQIKRQNRQLAEHIEYQKQKLLTLAKTISEKSRIIRELERNLPAGLRRDLTTAEKAQLELKEALSAQQNWDEFQAHFEQVYPGFLKRLANLCPTLSRKELSVCALIKIGLTSSGMADLLYRSKRSIDSHRRHIRHKLNLNSDQDLKEFFHTI